MKLSYAITVCNEFVEIQRLVNFLVANKRAQDEIIVLVDLSKNKPTSELLGYLHKLSYNDTIILVEDIFNNHFADWKNRLTRACTGDYIFQIDADEMVSTYVLDMVPAVLQHNSVDVIKVPRINTVDGITPEHIETWKWDVNEHGWINFPDYQWRIYKNNGEIKWVNKVHERLEGYKTMSYLPTEMEWCLIHNKTIKKQERQNKLYNNL
jgi:hypothetical protein|tara:strand:- start:7395 stop:8021 length:627 start_codon:yes stop_codon:yes gene_type:complete